MRTVYQVDAFTDRLFEGNPAGVVLAADGLTDATMQAIASELGCSETAFVLRPTRPGATHRVRFFAPAREVPVCGHATVATFFTLATRGEVSTSAVMECAAGDLPVEIERGADGEPSRVTMTQSKASFADAPFRGVVSQSVNLPPDVVAPKPAPGLVNVGEWVAILPVTDPSVLAHCVPQPPRIGALGGTRKAVGIYVVALDAEAGPVARVRARFFGGAGLVIVEDPATGVAAGALGAWLVKHARLAAGDELVVEQGVERLRPSTLAVRVGADGRPRVTGRAVIAFETKLDV
jgi:trans-2,3-dihydro-3-hydroxyanthranilate isomerase